MTEQDYVARWMDQTLDKAIDLAEKKAEERDVHLPPEIVGQLAVQMFQARMSLLFHDPSEYKLPEDEQWESF